MPYPKTAILEAIKELLKAGATRATIQAQIQAQYNKSQRQIDEYLAQCQTELAADDAEIRAATLAARKERSLQADAQLPTEAELLLQLWQVAQFKEISGYEVKNVGGNYESVARLASEVTMVKIYEMLIAYQRQAAADGTPDASGQVVLVINNSERLIENEEDLTE